ncbi:MAG: hypothetical protein JJ863_38640 [Deltaproteobacteria bacterium]|nr:hypothetical protein [Deltaproteobacteria bacterium]
MSYAPLPPKPRLALFLGLAAVAACDCGGGGSDGARDGMAVSSDGSAGDGAAAPYECDPSGPPATLSCPEGCTEWTVRVVDVSGECTTTDELVGACFPDDAELVGTGEAVCFTHPDAEGLVVWSPSSVIGVSGGPANILESAGWVRCSAADKVRYEGFCE